MKSTKLFLTLIALLIFHKFATAGFEGNITFVKQTIYDTTYSVYSVKNNLVRIDQHNARHQIVQTMIVDIQNENIVALCPTLKLYTKLRKNANNHIVTSEFQATKTKNYKYIDGYKCFQWLVRNRRINSEVSFWVVESDFDFFKSVATLLGKTEDYSSFCSYYDQIPKTNGFFPIMIVERTLVRDEKMRVSVQRINRCRVDEKTFKIPRDYKYMRS
jgi:hypothetical protein